MDAAAKLKDTIAALKKDTDEKVKRLKDGIRDYQQNRQAQAEQQRRQG